MQEQVLNRTAELGSGRMGQLLWTYALPAMVSQVIASIYNIVDRIFLGQYVGALAIAGLAITMPIMNIIHALGSLVGVGASSRLSIVLGRGDKQWAEKIVGNSMLLTFFFGALFISTGYLFMDKILDLFGASQQTIAYAREYLMIVLPGMFLMTITFNLTGLMRASGYPHRSMWIMAGGAIMNIVLDAFFICILDWQIAGAAWATTISMAVTTVFSAWHFMSRKSFIRFHRHAWTPKLYIVRNILLIGISPFSMNTAASAVVALLNNQLIKYGGDLAVGAYGVTNTYCAFMVMLVLGICQGMQPIAGYNYGAGKNERLKQVFTLTMKVNILVGIVGMLLALTMPRLILRAFTTDTDMIELGIPAMRYLNVMMPLIALTITNSQFFQSIDKPGIAITTSLSRQVIFLIPMMFLIPNLFIRWGHSDGLTGIWVACTVCDVLGAMLALTLLWTQRHVFQPGYVAPVHKP
ncbi:MAG: MATE family efflux transporter, partial [Bacteroidales bacterium]|nr:MATE family efflux transporter [Bacteroidales bacterium]